MRQTIPAPVLASVAEMVSTRETHATMDSLFMHAGAPGDPPGGSKQAKALEWLRRVNKDTSVTPLEVLGRLIEGYMDENLEGKTETWEVARSEERQHLLRELQRAKLQYSTGGIISGSLATPSASLEEQIRKRNIPSLNEEFERALRTVESSPKDSLSAACNILESICKVYIEEENLEMPKKQDLQPVWTVVRKDLALDPSLIEDQDLQKILTGLISVVDGVGALRTHASTAHGAGKKSYRVEPRHARLAIHAAHTVVLFVLETWDKRKAKM
ncbi:MAG TPA: abortive infection family protein [Candidatus Hydrogenedentes bacterium]|nr:abortive infection family protein [Candidatus Hydrogenedentota bacterium]HPG66456.1 abortive infection family protein [Candidatus Hydrogenedentota bacterium]